MYIRLLRNRIDAANDFSHEETILNMNILCQGFWAGHDIINKTFAHLFSQLTPVSSFIISVVSNYIIVTDINNILRLYYLLY